MKTTLINENISGAAKQAADILKNGGLVVFPTDTVYGLGALMSRPDAVKRIYEIKHREKDKPLSVLAKNPEMALALSYSFQPSWHFNENTVSFESECSSESRQSSGSECSSESEQSSEKYQFQGDDTSEGTIVIPGSIDEINVARLLAERFWPGPLTIVMKKNEKVDDIITAGKETVGVRVPGGDFARQLFEILKEPVVTTSANISGEPAAITGEEAAKSLDGMVELIVDGGECPVKKASTVVEIKNGKISILREGNVTAGDIRLLLFE